MAPKRFESQFLIGVIILSAALVALIFLPELNVIVLGIGLAILFEPWYVASKKWLNGKGGLAAALIVVVAVLLVLVPLTFFGLQIFLEAQGLYAHIASGQGIAIVGWLRTTLQHFFPSLNINIDQYIQQILGIFINNIGPIFSGVAKVVATALLSFFALYYFLKDGAALHDAVVARSPLPKEDTEKILETLRLMTSSVIRGSLLVGIFYGIFTGLGFFIFGLPSAILWGGVTVIASFIPMFGVLLVVVPGILSLAAGGNIIGAIGLTAWLFVMSMSVESFVRPWLIGRKAKIHPMMMLFAVLGGLSFFGPIGLLLGPLALSLLLTLLEIYPFFALENLKKK